jgi:hypothetical protein
MTCEKNQTNKKVVNNSAKKSKGYGIYLKCIDGCLMKKIIKDVTYPQSLIFGKNSISFKFIPYNKNYPKDKRKIRNSKKNYNLLNLSIIQENENIFLDIPKELYQIESIKGIEKDIWIFCEKMFGNFKNIIDNKYIFIKNKFTYKYDSYDGMFGLNIKFYNFFIQKFDNLNGCDFQKIISLFISKKYNLQITETFCIDVKNGTLTFFIKPFEINNN